MKHYLNSAPKIIDFMQWSLVFLIKYPKATKRLDFCVTSQLMNSKRRASFCVALGKVMHNKKPKSFELNFYGCCEITIYFGFDDSFLLWPWNRIENDLEFKVCWPQFLKEFFGCFQSKDEKLNLFSTHAKDVEAGETKTIRINENLRYLLLAGGPKMWVFHIQAFVYALEFTSLILSSHKATRLTCEGQGWSSLILLTIIWKPFGYSEPWNLNHCPSNLVNLTIPFLAFFQFLFDF